MTALNHKKFEVILNDKVLARDMDYDIAVIFVGSLFSEFCGAKLTVSIREQERKDDR